MELLKAFNATFPNWWKYLIIVVVSVGGTAIFLTCTDFWKPNIDYTDEVDEKIKIHQLYLENEENIRLEFEERMREIEEEFYERPTREELSHELDMLLDIHRESCDSDGTDETD